MTTQIITSLVGHQIAFRASLSEAFGPAHTHCEPSVSCSVQFSSVAQSPWTAARQASCCPWFLFQESGDGNASRLLVSEVGGATPADRWSQSKSFWENLYPQAAEGGEKN